MAVFTLALALGLSAPAVQAGDLQQDLRCVVALQSMIDGAKESGDATGKAAVTGVMLVYLGRVTTRIAPAQVESSIDKAGEAMGSGDHKALALECIDGMRTLVGIKPS